MTQAGLNDPAIKLVSFDVFDTVIARRCGAPASIFRNVGMKLSRRSLLAIDPLVFQKMRVEAERRTRQHKGNRETTLAEIYAELNSFWALPRAVVEQMISIELETEAENLFAIPGASAQVQAQRSKGRRVAFISDMYLPEEFIRLILTNLGLLQKNEALYVSSRWGVSKADAGLYRLLLEREKVPASEAAHVGDSRTVDYEGARKLGIQAVHCDRGALNRYEVRLAEAEDQSADCAPALAGISRMARLAFDGFGEQQVAARLGASVAGPLLTQYAEWVMRTARNRGVKKLFFLARDGEALLRLCEILAPQPGAGSVELHYLYGSRQIWYPHALLKMDEAAAEFFAASVAFDSGSWQECAQLLGFEAVDLLATPLAAKWAGWRARFEDRRRLFLDLAGDPNLRARLKKWLTEKAALASRYIREAGLVENGHCGLVDCGWSGTWTDIVGDLVEICGGVRPEVYFLGQRARKTPARSETLAFLFNHQAGSGLKPIPGFFHVPVEFFLTANHGRTTGFYEEAGKLAPTLEPVDLQGFSQSQWLAFRGALLRFAELYASQVKAGKLSPDLRPASVDGVALLWERPTRGEAALLGGHAISLSPEKKGKIHLARPYRTGDLIRLVFKFRLPGYSPFWWHEGAQALSGTTVSVPMGVLWQMHGLARSWRDSRKAGAAGRSVFQMLLSAGKQLWWALQDRPDGACLPVEDSAIESKPANPRLDAPARSASTVCETTLSSSRT